MTAMDVFVTEGNVEIYLSGAYETLDPERRDALLRLVVEEESRMARQRKHLERNKERLADCEIRVPRQRALVSELQGRQVNSVQAEFVLQTFERCLALMRDHHTRLAERSEAFKL